MKNVPDRFRIATLLMALALGWFALATIFAEALTPKTQRFSQDPAIPDSISYDRLAGFAAAGAPLRGDLLADIAMARAAPALKPDKAAVSPETIATRERAIATARQSLSFSPHSSSMWLLMAMLQSQGQARKSSAEALKMSYLTSPADVNLIPTRLAIVSTSGPISDDELKSLARGDIRLILTRRPDLKPAITSAYRRGSPDGKAFINEVLQSIDPALAASLR
jgi:hypothetical protein